MDFTRIEKKLRQAKFFSGHLGSIRVPGHTIEHEEFYLSACLTSAKSVFYALQRVTDFQRQEHRWFKRQENRGGFEFYDYMKKVRDKDVHHGFMDAQTHTRYVDAQWVSGVSVAGLGTVEKENPDGTKVRGHGGTRRCISTLLRASRTARRSRRCLRPLHTSPRGSCGALQEDRSGGSQVMIAAIYARQSTEQNVNNNAKT